MTLRPRTLLIVASVAAVATACGSGSHSVASSADRTVDVVMVDNAFEPTAVEVRAGETVTFSFRNTGAVTHEATIGDQAVQDAHHDEMSGSGSVAPASEDDGHGESGDDGHGGGTAVRSVTVEPGQQGQVTQTFDEAGTVLIGCHEPGHWESGMKATISVS